MAYDHFSPDGNSTRDIAKHWRIEGAMCPIYDHEGQLIKHVAICWEYMNTQGTEYEIADVQYGSIDGVILPEICDIIEAMQIKMGLRNSLIIPTGFTHNAKL